MTTPPNSLAELDALLREMWREVEDEDLPSEFDDLLADLC